MAIDKQRKDLAEIHEEYKIIHRQFLLALVAALLAIFGGALVYKHLLHLTWLNAVYFCTVTLTTVGYGDIHPNTNASKLFTIFYIFIGIGIIGGFVNLLIKHSLIRREYRRLRRKSIK